MKRENPSFFDIRTILTIVIMSITFMGWQAYLQRKYPEAYKKKGTPAASTTQTPAKDGAVDERRAALSSPPTGKSVDAVPSAPSKEELVSVQNDFLAFDLSSKGMGLKNIRVLKYRDRQGETVQLGHPEQELLSLETRLSGRAESIDFKIEKVNENLYVGRAKVGELKITKAMEIVPDKYLIQHKVSASGSDARFVGLSTVLTEELNEPGKSSFLLPQFENQEFYVETAENHTREIFGSDDKQFSWSKVKLASIGSQYFTLALVDKSPVMPEGKAQLNHTGKAAELFLQYPLLAPGQDFQLEYTAFVGPKSFSLLHSIDPALAAVVDFGFFNWIARHIFGLLRWFYSLVGNWGVAIICLTLLVRLLVLPFNIYSYRSMKAMQTIQPQIQGLKERYKDDQQKQQQEMMRLMRENKVNPLGGCLPIFLQFPIFLALYQVLGHSIELYQAPFGLWIHDLSLKDPYYILPVLMGITMFIQQKTTPNATMDPAQAKVLMMMPVVFTFFMISLPSGLTLYMLVGAVFSVIQQTYFMRTTKTLSSGAT